MDELTYDQWISQITTVDESTYDYKLLLHNCIIYYFYNCIHFISTTNFFFYISTYHHHYNLAFDGVNIYSVGDKMTKKGWSLNALQSPACLHICCTVAHLGHHDEFIADLKASGR